MLPIEHTRGEALLALARLRFDPTLRPIEEQVIRHSCAYEDPAGHTPPAPDRTPTGRPLPHWQGPELRPALLRWLLTDPAATALLEPRGLRVWNARLTETLDLTGCRIPAALELRYCLLDAPILLASADLPTLRLRNSTLEDTLDAPFLKLHGPLLFNDITAAFTVRFDGAVISGEVSLNNTTLTAVGTSLSMQGATISNDLLIRPDLHASGSLELMGIQIGGLTSLSGAQLTTTFKAIDMDRASVHGDVELDKGFTCAGEISMIGSRIGGQLICNGATLTATDTCLTLDGARIDVGVFLVEGFKASGLIRMNAATIGAIIDCSGATLSCAAKALSLNGTRVAGSVFFNKSLGKVFTSTGAIDLNYAHIAGTLEFVGASLAGPDESLTVVAATITGAVFLTDGFAATGIVRLSSSKISGQLSCTNATFNTFIGDNLEIENEFLWQQIVSPRNTAITLSGAKIKTMRDDPASWPANGNLSVDGLQVQDLHPLHARGLQATSRIAWLNGQPESDLAEPQPWLHLASHFEAKGQKRAAKRVIFELRKHQSRANWKTHKLRRLGYLWDTTFARLEEAPLRILWSIVIITLLSGATFWHYRAHFAQTSEAAYRATHTPNYGTSPHIADLAYPRFQPYIYALENILPVVKLGQDDKWAPHPDPAHPHLYWTLMSLRWFLILSGYVQGGILAAAVTARFRT